MKKLMIMFLFASIMLATYAQSPFKPVSLFPDSKLLKAGEEAIGNKWAWRFDATILISEITRNTVTKEWASTSFSAIGPAIGLQNYVPKSDVDPTPVNVYGISLGVALGQTVYDPQLAQAKVVLAVNLWEYFKFGRTYTLNPPQDIAKLGLFFGGGITF